MKTNQMIKIAALAAAMGLAGNAAAADMSGMKNSNSTGVTSPAAAPSANTTKLGTLAGSAGANDKTSSFPPESFDYWMNERAGQHEGRISRQEFLDQMGSRWDQNDQGRTGYMTPDQARGIYTYGDTPARTGSDVKPGYMGPGNVKK